MNILIALYRTLLFYVVITILYRVMGKRELGQLSVIDLIVSILIAELAAISIDKYRSSLLITLIPIISLVIVQILSSKISIKSSLFRKKIEGEPSIIINRGKIDFKEMLKQRYNLDDLLTQLREKSISNIEEVDYAILETSGKLTVFPKKNNSNYPLPLIMDGKLDRETLTQIKKDDKWLEKVLRRNAIKIENIFYAFYRNDDLYIIKNKKDN